MNRHIAFCVLAAAISVASCTVHRPTKGIATPWGAAAVHSFRPYHAVSDPTSRRVDTQVAQVLDGFDSAEPQRGVRVAVR
jgi:hypothetical protein